MKESPSIHDLYSNFTEQELQQAEVNLDSYVALVLRIFERIESEPNPQADQLTDCTGTLGLCTPKDPSLQDNHHPQP